MAFATFQEIRGAIILRAPGTPIPIVEHLINQAYRRALDMFRWAGQRVEAELIIGSPYTTGTIELTQGDTAVTGTGTSWSSTFTGRQLIVNGRAPYYAFTRLTNTTGTISPAWAEDDESAAEYALQEVYLTPEDDFLAWVTVRDIEQGIVLNHYNNAEWLDEVDPQRTSEGDPSHLVGATFTSAPPRWEIWPRPSAGLTLSTRYLKRPTDLSANADVPIFPIRGSGLMDGALAELSLWPGTAERPNPYFRPDLHALHEARFLEALKHYQRQDQEIAQTDITVADDGGTLSGEWAQEHAVPE